MIMIGKQMEEEFDVITELVIAHYQAFISQVMEAGEDVNVANEALLITILSNVKVDNEASQPEMAVFAAHALKRVDDALRDGHYLIEEIRGTVH
jgi:hypothetical protein